MINAFIDFVIKRHGWVTVLIILITVPLGYYYFHQKFFNHISIFFEKNDPKIVNYEEFQSEYGNEELAVILFKARDIFTKDNISIIRKISEMAQSSEGVQRVMSITEAEEAVGEGDTVSFKKIVPENQNLSDSLLRKAKKRALHHQVILETLLSPDTSTTAILIELEPIKSNEKKGLILEKIMKSATEIAGKRIRLHFSGSPYVEHEIDALTLKDNKRFTPMTFVIIFILVFFLLKNIRLSILCQINIILVIVWGIGFFTFCGQTINMVTVVIPPVLLAISIADSIHLLSHYKQIVVTNSMTSLEAVKESTRSLWFPCLFTSLTTAVGFLSFMTTTIGPVRVVGLYVFLGVMAAFFLTMTFLPASLAFFKKPFYPENHKNPDNGLFFRSLVAFGKLTTSYHKVIFWIFIIIMAVAVMGTLKIKYETNFSNYLHEDNKIKQDIRFAEKNLFGTVPIVLLIKARSEEFDFNHPAGVKLVEEIEDDIQKDLKGRYTSFFSIGDYFKEINKAFNKDDEKFYTIPDKQTDIMDYYDIGDAETLDRVISPDHMEARISFNAYLGSLENAKILDNYLKTFLQKKIGENYSYRFTGISSLYVAMDRMLRKSQLRSFASAFIVIFIMMYFVCKNIKLTIISMLPNIFPIILTFGIMGWFRIPLDVATIMIASVTIGIAVDDTIHFLVWFRRNVGDGMTRKNAIKKTFKDAGRPIVITSMILCIVYLVLITGSVKPIRAFGALASLSMCFALIGDLFILPALIMVFKPEI